MSMSDQETSQPFNVESSQSQMDSPYSSPSQQVPQLVSFMDKLSSKNTYTNTEGEPFLRIVEQPENHFRFRYKSEINDSRTRRCLLGKSNSTNKTKTHPTAELVNYGGRALIRCSLAQDQQPDEHPHKLFEDDQERDVSAEVPEQGSYKVGFAGVRIISTAKKDVGKLFYKKYVENGTNMSRKELRKLCANAASEINLNIVRLKFTAHDIITGQMICSPVFSEPIYNLKSVTTNNLKISCLSCQSGSPKGGDDVFMLVEKVFKKNIRIRFVEINENGEELWSAYGNFLQSDVHHQYAIVFRTPAYKNPKITSNVKVYIELQRPSDGTVSERKEFTYNAESVNKNLGKKKRANSAFSSIDSSSGSSIKSSSELPATMEQMLPKIPRLDKPTSNELGDVSLHNMSGLTQGCEKVHVQFPASSSEKFDEILKADPYIHEEDRNILCQDFTRDNDYSLSEVMDLFYGEGIESDSGRSKVKSEPVSPKKLKETEANDPEDSSDKTGSKYSAVYKYEDGLEVKKILKDLFEMMRNKFERQEVKSKLDRLFELRLINGDNFLHMALCSNVQSMDYIVRVIHNMQMTHLLNIGNNQEHTILHLAVINDMPKQVASLVAKGCDPRAEDMEGNNVIHFAVIRQACLQPLLEAIKMNKVQCNLNANNNDKQTALHLAARNGSESDTRLLLQHGASCNVTDSHGRTPLHIATYDDNMAVIKALLEYVAITEIDVVDGAGKTALQIICDRAVRKNSIEIVKLLLDKNADPMKNEEGTIPAWKLCCDKPELMSLIMKRDSKLKDILKDDIKSEPEDKFESADEAGADVGLQKIPLYINKVSSMLDSSGRWWKLVKKMHLDSLMNWIKNTLSYYIFSLMSQLNHI